MVSGVLATETLPAGNYIVLLDAFGPKKNEKVAQTLTITLIPAELAILVNGTPVRLAGRPLDEHGETTCNDGFCPSKSRAP